MTQNLKTLKLLLFSSWYNILYDVAIASRTRALCVTYVIPHNPDSLHRKITKKYVDITL